MIARSYVERLVFRSRPGSYVIEPNSNAETSKESKEKYSKLNLPLKKQKH